MDELKQAAERMHDYEKRSHETAKRRLLKDEWIEDEKEGKKEDGGTAEQRSGRQGERRAGGRQEGESVGRRVPVDKAIKQNVK